MNYAKQALTGSGKFVRFLGTAFLSMNMIVPAFGASPVAAASPDLLTLTVLSAHPVTAVSGNPDIPAVSFEQSRVNLKAKDISLADLLWEIQKQTGFTFIYSTDDIGKLNIDEIEVRNSPLEDVLSECISGNGLSYDLEGEVVTISRNNFHTAETTS